MLHDSDTTSAYSVEKDNKQQYGWRARSWEGWTVRLRVQTLLCQCLTTDVRTVTWSETDVPDSLINIVFHQIFREFQNYFNCTDKMENGRSMGSEVKVWAPTHASMNNLPLCLWYLTETLSTSLVIVQQRDWTQTLWSIFYLDPENTGVTVSAWLWSLFLNTIHPKR